jgi:hypothetical protein
MIFFSTKVVAPVFPTGKTHCGGTFAACASKINRARQYNEAGLPI